MFPNFGQIRKIDNVIALFTDTNIAKDVSTFQNNLEKHARKNILAFQLKNNIMSNFFKSIHCRYTRLAFQ
jgi:hypothetical protein